MGLRSALLDTSDITTRARSEQRMEHLQRGFGTGLPELRAWIAGHLAHEEINVSADDILVTSGAKHGIQLICRLLLEKGDSVMLSAPACPDAIQSFRRFGVNFIEVDLDSEGIELRELQRMLATVRSVGRLPPKFIYVAPDYHDPAGVTMTAERRRAFLTLAARERLPVLEDCSSRPIQFEGTLPPPLKALDDNGLVLHVGTLSRALPPGLRFGWIAAAPEMVAQMAQLQPEEKPSALAQRSALEFCRTRMLSAHLEHIRREYRVRRDVMLAALRELLPETAVRVPAGGLYLWLALPTYMNGNELAKRARAAGVRVRGPSECFAGPGHPVNHIRLAYSRAAVDEIVHGLRRLARTFRTMPSARSLERC